MKISELQEARNSHNLDFLKKQFSKAYKTIATGGTVRVEREFSDSSVETAHIIDSLEDLERLQEIYCPGCMTVETSANSVDNLVEVKIRGKLTVDDYELMAAKIETLLKKSGKARMLIELHDFKGWTAGALWEDIKFDFKHFNDFERIAVAGENRWEKGMTLFFKPFSRARIRYFESDRLTEARSWLIDPQSAP